jgi:HAMP domain-containing protein
MASINSLFSRALSKPGRLLRNGPLARQMLLSICCIFLFVMLVSQVVVARLFTLNAITHVDEQANLIMATMNGVRNYTSDQVNPIIDPINQQGKTFKPQAVPNYAAQSVFSYVSASPEYAAYAYSEPTLNPTNPSDLAKPDEKKIIEQFIANPTLTKLTGSLKRGSSTLHYIAKPIRVTSQSCLQCHHIPEKAPSSVIATYGDDNGFNWKLNSVVGMQIVSVPTETINNRLKATVLAAAFALMIGLLLVALLTNTLLDKLLISPLRSISQKASHASINPSDVEFQETHRSDEVGALAASLERMRQSLVIAMRMLKN